MVAAPSHLHRLALIASDFTDPEHERTIYLAAGGLAALGIVLLVATVLWWRATKGEHAALAPLELMGQRSWVRAPHVEQVRQLERVRVRSAGSPVEPEVRRSEEIDLDELLRSFQPGFDDLREESVLVDAAPDSPPAVTRATDAGPSASDADAGPSASDAETVRMADDPSRARPPTSEPSEAAVGIAGAGDLIVDAAPGDQHVGASDERTAASADPATG